MVTPLSLYLVTTSNISLSRNGHIIYARWVTKFPFGILYVLVLNKLFALNCKLNQDKLPMGK
jgi:hypothetical protein